MDILTDFFRLDFPAIFLSVFIIFAGIKTVVSLLEWLFQKAGLEFKWMRG